MLGKRTSCLAAVALAATVPLCAAALSRPVSYGAGAWKAVLVQEGEKGQPLEVSGVVLATGGQAVAGAKVYVYQTDANGLYSLSGKDPDDEVPRLRGEMRTDAKGRFHFRTIRPAGYPGGRAPQHIHYQVTADGFRGLGGEILFDDDPRLTKKVRSDARARHWPVVRPKLGSDGVERCDITLRLSPR